MFDIIYSIFSWGEKNKQMIRTFVPIEQNKSKLYKILPVYKQMIP